VAEKYMKGLLITFAASLTSGFQQANLTACLPTIFLPEKTRPGSAGLGLGTSGCVFYCGSAAMPL
jgi:hypothetical protein